MSPTIKYDVSDVELREDRGAIPLVARGVYPAKVAEVTAKDSSKGNAMLEVIFRLDGGDYDEVPLWHYIVLPSDDLDEVAGRIAEERLAEFVLAIGGKKKGQLNTDRAVGKPVQVRVKHETYEEEPRAKVAAVLPPGDVDDEEEEGDGDEGTQEDLTRDDLDDMERAELKSLIKEEDLGIRVTKSKSDDDIRDAIAEAMELEGGDDEEEPDEDDEPDEDEDGDDYEEWSVQELRDEAKQRGLKAGGTKAVIVKRLRKDDESDDEPF